MGRAAGCLSVGPSVFLCVYIACIFCIYGWVDGCTRASVYNNENHTPKSTKSLTHNPCLCMFSICTFVGQRGGGGGVVCGGVFLKGGWRGMA